MSNSIPKFTSRISMAQHVGSPPQPILSTDPAERDKQLTNMIDTSLDGYIVIEDKTLPRIDINITYEEGKGHTAIVITRALTMFLEKLKTQL